MILTFLSLPSSLFPINTHFGILLVIFVAGVLEKKQLFSNYLPFTKDFFALYFGNVEFHFLKNICTKFGKFSQIVLEEDKCEKFTKRRTDDGQQ